MSYSYQGITSVSVRGTGISEDEPVTTSIHGPDKPCQRYCHLTFNTIVRALCVLIFLGCIGFCGLLLYFSWYPLNIKLEAALTVGASSFDEFGRYVMNNFDDAKPTANFLAGLGGIWGTPMVRSVTLLHIEEADSRD